jgi:glucosamine--fructose-6-phosphate aminotransferase (isomerizing)
MNSMVSQVNSLPDLIRESVSKFDEEIRGTLDHEFCLNMRRLFIVGCGDSHHAALNTELAFEALAGVPTEPMRSMQFSTYVVGYLPDSGPGMNVVMGISVSGEVARTVEGLRLAKKAGATTLALTGTPGGRVDQAGDKTIFSTTTPFPDPPGVHTPGVRSFAANQLALLLIAVRLGEVRGVLTTEEAGKLRGELASLADAAEQTIDNCDPIAKELAETWKDADEFVFTGNGPNFGTALFSAAKVLEASGDSALGQETEEWAHLQYFARKVSTPTFMINTGKRDLPRVIEVAKAAKGIGRRVVAIAPSANTSFMDIADASMPLADGVRDAFSAVIAAIPGELFAAYRADAIGEPFFRNFGGGRSIEGGGGISRIRTSDMLEDLPE